MRPESNTTWECGEKKVLVPELNTTITTNHSFYVMNGEEVYMATFNVLPYCILIKYSKPHTSIYKLVRKPPFNKKERLKTFEYISILELESAVNFPLRNRTRTIERIKMLLLFS